MEIDDNKDLINIGSILNVLLDRSRLISLITSIFAISSVLYSLSLNNIYQSYATIYVEDPTGTKFSGGSSGLSSLASLAGFSIDTGNQKEDKVQLVLAMLKSYKLAEDLLQDSEFLPPLLATKKIEKSSGKIVFDKKIFNSDTQKWLDKDGNNISGPSAAEVYKALGKSLKASYSKRSGFLNVSIEHESATFATSLLSLILLKIDSNIRNRDEFNAENSIKFLKQELEIIETGELRAAVSALIQSELQKIILAKRDSTYILKFVQPPFVPFEKNRPSRATICIMGTILGFIFSSLLSLFLHTRKS
tara:strand:+ start:402 stop:1316 length:915 start_codon:yes stop_codon:yes gene_type:complete